MIVRERLRPDHGVDAFTCAEPTLDRWLRASADGADRAGTARTYVWVDDDGVVVAYFSLAPHLVRRSELSSRIARGSPDVIPAVLLARLALAEGLQGRRERFGTVLLFDALDVATDAIRQVGGRLIVVDALDDRARFFYEHHGFVAVPDDPYRLVVKASDVAKSLGKPWP